MKIGTKHIILLKITTISNSLRPVQTYLVSLNAKENQRNLIPITKRISIGSMFYYQDTVSMPERHHSYQTSQSLTQGQKQKKPESRLNTTINN